MPKYWYVICAGLEMVRNWNIAMGESINVTTSSISNKDNFKLLANLEDHNMVFILFARSNEKLKTKDS